MTRSEKLIAVLEVIVSYLFVPEIHDAYNPIVNITVKDFPDGKMSFHTLGATLSLLHEARVLKVERILSPQYDPEHDEMDLETPFGFRLFVDGNPWRVLRELEYGTQFENISSEELLFDKKQSILEVQGKSIKIARQIQKPVEHYILEFLFTNELKQAYGYDELKDAKVYDAFAPVKTYINACKTLNTKIKKETNEKITDFLVYGKTERGSVQINPKYLS